MDSCKGSCQHKGRKHIFVYSGLDSCKGPGTKVGISRLCGPESMVNGRRGTLRDRICDFGSVLDSCKGLVRAIYSVLSVARGLVSSKGPCQWYLIVFLQCFGQLRGTLRDRICDFGNVLDSCKGLVKAIYSVLSVARGLVSGKGPCQWYLTVFLQCFGPL